MKTGINRKKKAGALKIIFPACFFVLLLAGSCTSMVEKAGRTLDGSASEDRRIAVYRAKTKEGADADAELWEVQNKAGVRSIVIMLDQFPSIKIRGSFPNDSGEFFFTSLDYLAGSYHGWNEYSMDLFGQGSLVLHDNAVALVVPEKFEAVHISSGRIKRYDTRITGDEALSALRNRQERISALVEWMQQLDDAPKGLDRKAFEKYWKPVLFPEMVSRKKQPLYWKQDGDLWVRAEDVRWNTGYTGRVFPQALFEIRNSGTMLRDWEEALPWIYVEYEWERILGMLSQEITLYR